MAFGIRRNKFPMSRSDKQIIWLSCGLTALIGFLIASPFIFYISSTETVTATVLKTERVNKGEHSHYLVYADNETFTLEDSLWFWKFNSSDQYGQIEAGKRYSFKVVGWRIPFFSFYRNILTVQKLE